MNILNTPIVRNISLTLALSVGVCNTVAKSIEPTGVESIDCDNALKLSGIEELYECSIRKGSLDGKMAYELPDGILDESFVHWFDEQREDRNYINFYPPKKGNAIYRLFQDNNTKRFWILLISEGKSPGVRTNREGG